MSVPEQATLHFTTEVELQDEAKALVEFDMGSIRQMVAAGRGPEPSVWLANPGGYEKNGHVLRDNDTIRLVAWVAESAMIYATDGCNSCWHTPGLPIEGATDRELASFSSRSQIPESILRTLAGLIRERQS